MYVCNHFWAELGQRVVTQGYTENQPCWAMPNLERTVFAVNVQVRGLLRRDKTAKYVLKVLIQDGFSGSRMLRLAEQYHFNDHGRCSTRSDVASLPAFHR